VRRDDLSGAIGDVTEVHISTGRALTHRPPRASQGRSRSRHPRLGHWQGGSTPRPFSVEYVPYNWRGFVDYGTSQIGNWATHTAGPVAFALQLALHHRRAHSVEGKSGIAFPDRGVVRLDFPARGGMPAVKVFYHDSMRPTDAGAFHVPGMEDEVILPPSNNLSDKGRPMGPAPDPRAVVPPRRACPDGAAAGHFGGGPGVKVYGVGSSPR